MAIQCNNTTFPTVSRGHFPAPSDPEYDHAVYHFNRGFANIFHGTPNTPGFVPFNPATHQRTTREFYKDKHLSLVTGQILNNATPNTVEVWGFFDPDNSNVITYPSVPLRYTQDKIIHTTVHTHHGPHTIHHHGLEPEPINDGVGHVTMEVDGQYIYQMVPRQAGTFFYHCHRNTPLHFQMGMFGFLIIDPPTGPGTLYEGGPKYDVEALWAVTEIDRKWHVMDKSFGQPPAPNDIPGAPQLSGFTTIAQNTSNGAPGLHVYDPDIFLISGVPQVKGNPTPGLWQTDPRSRITSKGRETILIRLLCGGYKVQRYTFGLDVELVAEDGRPLGVGANPTKNAMTKYSRPITIKAGQPFTLTTARRYDLIIKPKAGGKFPVKIEFLNWITGQVDYSSQTYIEVKKWNPVPYNLLLG
ncbi:multicopper oxidase domain-containing protein [Fundidesulfovibrio soli]|uniref:multicopper oxidase domain-containing protein n=1 Tax=Fundidesulfovibrio soli TaxID=2922716 RepID=UPI001FAEAFB3|nr:multicopper oxidase domain-containing protein [Fundidesulfovibrio soli]